MSIKHGLKFKNINFSSKTWNPFYDLTQPSPWKYDADINSVVLETIWNPPSHLGSFYILAKSPGIGQEEEKKS